MTSIGPVEAEMRARAREVRQKFFARPDNDNAPVDRTQRPPVDGEVTLFVPYTPKCELKRERDPRGAQKVLITPEQSVQIGKLIETMSRKHGLDITKVPNSKYTRKLCDIRSEMAWHLKYQIGLTNTNVADVLGLAPNNITKIAGRYSKSRRPLDPFWRAEAEGRE